MWIISTIGYVISDAIENVFQKKATLHFNEYIITWSILAISSLFYIPLLIASQKPESLNELFWIGVVGRIIIDSFALVFYVKAIKLSQLSLAVPMISLKPVFILIATAFINGLFPSSLGLLGVLVVVVGVYLLNFDYTKKKVDLLSPFKNILKEKGVQYMLAAAFLWGFVVAFQKLSIDNSNPHFYTSFFQPLWALVFTPVAFLSDRKSFFSLFKFANLKKVTPIGFFDGLKSIAENIAFTLALPAYVSALESSGILLTAIFGSLFFKEKIGYKLIPILIIIIGVVLVTFAQ